MGILEILFGNKKEKSTENEKDWIDELIMLDEIFGDEED